MALKRNCDLKSEDEFALKVPDFKMNIKTYGDHCVNLRYLFSPNCSPHLLPGATYIDIVKL